MKKWQRALFTRQEKRNFQPSDFIFIEDIYKYKHAEKKQKTIFKYEVLNLAMHFYTFNYQSNSYLRKQYFLIHSKTFKFLPINIYLR